MDNIVTIEQLAKTPEKHGRLLSFCWSSFTTGWLFGTDAVCEMSLERTRQSPMLHVERKPSGGQRSRKVYTADESLLERLGELTERENMAAWSALRFSGRLAPEDQSYMEIITMIFDDSDIGGRGFTQRRIDVREVRGQGRGEVIDEILDLLRSAQEEDRLVSSVTDPFSGAAMFGMTGAGMPMMGFIAMGLMNSFNPNVHMPQQQGWTCQRCGHGDNSLNFCPECGQRRCAETDVTDKSGDDE